MKLKDFFYHLSIGLLTAGASLILGLLSFGGMFALWPILPLAFLSLVLSVVVESQIYLENFKSVFQKFFQPNFLKLEIATHYLDNYPHNSMLNLRRTPEFFRDYARERATRHHFAHKRLNQASQEREALAITNLEDIREMFCNQLFLKPTSPSSFDVKLKSWLQGRPIIHLASASELPTNGRHDTYFFIADMNVIYYKHPAPSKKLEEIEVSDAWIQSLHAHFYTESIQQWLNGCHVEVVKDEPKPIDIELKNRYVFVEASNKLFYYNQWGEADPVIIAPENIKPFKSNLVAVMKNRTSAHLTPTKLAKLTATKEPTSTSPLVTLLSDKARLTQQYQQQAWTDKVINYGSILSAAFMTLGTMYLLVETFAIIPWLAAIPAVALPILIPAMALIAGIAYGLLTCNAFTQMSRNNSLLRWYKQFREDFRQGITLKNTLMLIATLCIFSLTFALTICTAGTWWTLVKYTRPLFAWMGKIPAFLTQCLLPVVIAISTLGFNLENTTETLSEIDKASRHAWSWKDIKARFRRAYDHLVTNENIWQIVNPFRVILKLTVTPLRVLCFIGHLISIGVTADRLPGVPEIVSALLGIISEGFEDLHYFFDLSGSQTSDCEGEGSNHSHNHDQDIPTLLINALFYPIYYLAAYWDYKASLSNKSHPTRPMLSMNYALNKQRGLKPEQDVDFSSDLKPSVHWQKQHALHLLHKQQKHLEGYTLDSTLATKKASRLSKLQKKITKLDMSNPQTLKTTLDEAKKKPVYGKHRIAPSLFKGTPTETQSLLNSLSERAQPKASFFKTSSGHIHNARCGHTSFCLPTMKQGRA